MDQKRLTVQDVAKIFGVPADVVVAKASGHKAGEDFRTWMEAAFQKLRNAQYLVRQGILSEADYADAVNQIRAEEGYVPLPDADAMPIGYGHGRSIPMGIGLTDEQREAIRKQWQERHTGPLWVMPVETMAPPGIDTITKDAIRRIDLLQPKDGDILAIECQEPLTDEQMARLTMAVNEHLKAADRGRVLIIDVESLGEIRTLDAGAMRAHGWVRLTD